jgi:DNA-3-methyladenine glycosylase I
MTAPKRCPWPGEDPLYVAYHDREWGVPVRQGQELFEKLILDGFQAGLSWLTILRKRARFREVFAGFDPEQLARFGKTEVRRLMADPGIVRNRAKIEGAITSARAFLAVEEKHSFAELVWSFVGGAPRTNRWRSIRQIPSESDASRTMAKALKQAGFTFCGPTICYAFMQAVGMVNDHLISCFRHAELAALAGP